MAFTKVLPSGISSASTLTVDSLDSVGAISATSINATTGTFSGNLNVAGVLTYEDVTNVDSIGLVTARSGIHVTGGSVGIGTDNPTTKLYATDTQNGYVSYTFVNDSNGSGAVNRIQLGNDASPGSAQLVVYGSQHSTLPNVFDINNANNNDMRLLTNNTERLRITSSGNVGIGTDNPSNRMHLYSTTDGAELLQLEIGEQPANTEKGKIIWRATQTGGSSMKLASIGGNTINNWGGELQFFTKPANSNPNDAIEERLRITSGGKVFLPGTQTDSDEAGRLDIYHTADDGINNPHIRLWGPANQDARIEFGSPTNTGEGGYIMYNDSDEGLYIGSRMGGYGEVNLCTGMNDGSPTSNIRLRVTSGGNVEIANGNLVFSTSGTGIDFSATSDAGGMTSELLDDYEEGSVTLTATPSSGTITVTGQSVYYTKIGRLVTLAGFFQTSQSSASGNVTFGGLPFNTANTTGGSAGGTCQLWKYNGGNPTEIYPCSIHVVQNNTTFQLYFKNSSGNAEHIEAADMNGTSNIGQVYSFHLSYTTP